MNREEEEQKGKRWPTIVIINNNKHSQARKYGKGYE
jgi:hypothetical protein